MQQDIMAWFMELTAWVAPFFIVMSPVLSYSDQIISMYRNKTSAGFSLDIPLIMLVASLLRIFYWPHAQYDTSLLLQSLLMIIVQVVLLKVALDYRPPPPTKGGEAGLPFAGGDDTLFGFQRPYNFWQWRSPRRYWHAIMYFAGALFVLELLLSQIPGLYGAYANAIGCIGLGVEATLPIPQILINYRSKSSAGLRLSVLAAWIGGDTMKLFWFFTAKTAIPWSFKISGMFQASCDFFLGFQYLLYNSREVQTTVKEHPMKEWTTRSHSRSLTPTRHAVPFMESEQTE
ncbi:hypothetical protein FSOLCH5_010488 [Fusarium solani]|uniref:uncharacterized protein n=1 Tax=Fusarium solani TaxID=169388 RepID=UPI00230B8183|nr:hypothetical protein MRS44_012680 [Fusarium solani]KAJ4212095.1 hypothetical protein NW759_012063 [Fusarium solani]